MSEPPCQKIPAVIYATGTSTDRIVALPSCIVLPPSLFIHSRAVLFVLDDELVSILVS